MKKNILVLGATGHFGSRISKSLSQDSHINLLVSGRNLSIVQKLASELSSLTHTVAAIQLDFTKSDWGKALSTYNINLLLNASGPYQNQDYQVAEECIKQNINYIDLADGREFVSNIKNLNNKAEEKNVFVIAGASSVPGLSSYVVDKYLGEFKSLKRIQHGINPGNQTLRGESTVKSILSYCGKPFTQYTDGSYSIVYGWQNLYKRRFPPSMGSRWMGNCDIPDLELFPKHYSGVNTVKFDAGLELSLLHLGTWVLSWTARIGVIKDWSKYSKVLTAMSEWFYRFGSESGGMYVELEGLNHNNQKQKITWHILAGNGDGPQIPCTASVVLAKKYARGELTLTGATACLSLFSTEEFMSELSEFSVEECAETTII